MLSKYERTKEGFDQRVWTFKIEFQSGGEKSLNDIHSQFPLTNTLLESICSSIGSVFMFPISIVCTATSFDGRDNEAETFLPQLSEN